LNRLKGESHTDDLAATQNYNSRKEAIMDEKSKGDAMMVEHNEGGNRRVDSHDSERTARDPTNTPVRLQNKRKAVV